MKVKLNKDFYKREAVEEAINDFKEACGGRILNGKMEIELSPKENAENLKEEFCNYVLGLMINKNIA